MVPGDQGQSMTHPYSHEIQLKLYQAFIFSIPILFSIILFLLFYLFYLKRRAYILTTSPSIVPRTFRHPNGPTSFVTLTCEMNLKGELKENLPKVLFDEELKARDSVCCVCLGEFEMKEELIQVPSCKHMFHVECISHWLQSNSTCPLCRCSVAAAAAAAAAGPSPSIQPNLQQAHINIPNHHQQLSTVAAATVLSEEPSSSSSSNTTTTTAMGCSTLSVESVVVHIRPLDS